MFLDVYLSATSVKNGAFLVCMGSFCKKTFELLSAGKQAQTVLPKAWSTSTNGLELHWTKLIAVVIAFDIKYDTTILVKRIEEHNDTVQQSNNKTKLFIFLQESSHNESFVT